MPRMHLSALAVAALALSAFAKKIPIELVGVACETPPPQHCPDKDCPGPLVIQSGTAREPKTGREFFIDYPCGLKKGEKVTFVLSLHGFGSYRNWMRHYFPLMDFKDKYRLVIATPNASAPPPKAWAPVDDEYLQGIVNLADVVRESKGHTEGLEPQVTEQLIKLMPSAKKSNVSSIVFP